jgi:hypothetical protein
MNVDLQGLQILSMRGKPDYLHVSMDKYERMRAYKATQIPRSETQDIQIFKIQTKLFYCEK